MADQQSPNAPPAPPPLHPYGTPVTLQQARQVAHAAEAEALKNGWCMAIAVSESSGALVYFLKMDNTQYGSIEIALDKARTAAPVQPRCSRKPLPRAMPSF